MYRCSFLISNGFDLIYLFANFKVPLTFVGGGVFIVTLITTVHTLVAVFERVVLRWAANHWRTDDFSIVLQAK